jgi:hypothetical protein
VEVQLIDVDQDKVRASDPERMIACLLKSLSMAGLTAGW